MTGSAAGLVIRRYASTDEPSWLRCRALGFLDSAYFDDVRRSRRQYAAPDDDLRGWVACVGEEVIALLDVEVDGLEATIDTVATHPDHRGRGLATALLAEAVAELRAAGVAVLDAWTRDDPPALGWYAARGFVEEQHYLHVYAGDGDDLTGFGQPAQLSAPVRTFHHARLEDEEWARARFARVHVCRRCVLTLD